MKIEKMKEYKGFELNTKRFYLPFAVSVACQVCGEEITNSLNEQYLYYPTLGEPIERSVYCEDCDIETFFKLQLDVQLLFAENKK